MTILVWMLLGFAAWTLLLLCLFFRSGREFSGAHCARCPSNDFERAERLIEMQNGGCLYV